MIVLAFDTAITGCSVCVSDGGKDFVRVMETERGQAEFLVPMIDDVIAESGYAYQDIGRIGVTVGPGSFTGVRVGLSTAKALALSLNRPLAGFTTLEILARDIKEDSLVLIDTKRNDFYGQVFDAAGAAKDEARIWTLDEAEKTGLAIVRDRLPDIKILARATSGFTGAGEGYDPHRAPQPVYLRGAEVSRAKRIVPKIVKSVDRRDKTV